MMSNSYPTKPVVADTDCAGTNIDNLPVAPGKRSLPYINNSEADLAMRAQLFLSPAQLRAAQKMRELWITGKIGGPNDHDPTFVAPSTAAYDIPF